MDDLIYLMQNFGFLGYTCVLGLFSGIYILLMAPVLFKVWIIPKIERRYKTTLKLKEEDYPLVPFADWGLPPLAISLYVFCQYTGLQLPSIKNPSDSKTIFHKLNKVGYDVNIASKAEIISSFLTVFFLIYFLLIIFFVFIHDKIIIN